MKSFINYVFIVIGIISACSGHSSNSAILSKVDSLMADYPDSALHLLQQFPLTIESTSEDRAAYALLTTKALHKNKLPIQSDSLINIALYFYGERGNTKRLAESYFYKGVVCEEKKNVQQALYYYKQAETLIPKLKDHYLCSLIYQYIGFINSDAQLSDLALKYFHKSLNQSILANQPSLIVSSLQQQAIEYLYQDKTDSAQVLYEQCLFYLPSLKQKEKAAVYHNLGVFYLDYVENDSLGLDYIQKAILLADDEKRLRSYMALASHYSQEGNDIRADSLWNVAATSSDNYIRSFIYHARSSQNEKVGNYKDALDFHHKYTALSDSLSNLENSRTIAEVQAKYDITIVQRKYIVACLGLTIFVLLSVILLAVYQYRKWMDERKLNQLIRDNDAYVREMQNKFKNVLESRSAIHSEEIKHLNESLTRQIKTIDNLKSCSKQTSHTYTQTLAYYQSALSGIQCYIDILQNKDISQLSTKELRCFIDCYKIVDKKFSNWFEKKHVKLGPREIVLCIFYRMGKEKQDIICLLRCSDNAYRTMKNRIKNELMLEQGIPEVEKRVRELL